MGPRNRREGCYVGSEDAVRAHLAGLDDIFEKNRHDGPVFRKLAHASKIYRS